MLAAATTFATALGLLNLLLLLGVIKRLRDQAAAPAIPMSDVMLPTGQTPADFAVSTVDGETLHRDDVAGHLVGFFTSGCPACIERLPEFAARAATHRTVAVLIGEAEELTDLIAELAPVAQVVVQDMQGPLPKAFGVKGYPALSLVDSMGVISFSGTDFRGFPAGVQLDRPRPVGAHG